MQTVGQVVKAGKRVACYKGANAWIVPPRPEMHQVAVVQFARKAKGIGATRCRDTPRVVARRGLHRTGAIEHGADGAQSIVLVPSAVAAHQPCVAIHEVRGAVIEHLFQRCHEVLRVAGTAAPYEHTIAVVAVAGATLLGVAGAAVVEQVPHRVIGEPDHFIGGVVRPSPIGAVVPTK